MQLKEKNSFIDEYIDFLSTNKTERECVTAAEKILIANGFKHIKHYNVNGCPTLKAGDKVYFVNRNKNIAAFVIGKAHGRTEGCQLLGAHIDSPRLDVKPTPLYEKDNIAYFDLQYYGGIKKYQWTTIPLAIHGIVYAVKDGNIEQIHINIGEHKYDPIFCITDLLPHLDKKLSEKKASEFIKGEDLDLLIAITKKDIESNKSKDSVKEFVLDHLNKCYNITENDFVSAELEVVPAGPAHYCGLDKALVAGYGQDDRVCAFTSLQAILSIENPYKTCGCVLVDKEEIGSTCATGSKSNWLENILYVVSGLHGKTEFMTYLYNVNMLSSDVTAAFDPLHADVSNKEQTAKLNGGIMFSKYNGGRGKSGGADANPEFIAYVRVLMEHNKCHYQFDTMGKVDVGGGGTIASIVSNLNINVLDAGVPVLNMHSPLELAAVNDIYDAYNAYYYFLLG